MYSRNEKSAKEWKDTYCPIIKGDCIANGRLEFDEWKHPCSFWETTRIENGEHYGICTKS